MGPAHSRCCQALLREAAGRCAGSVSVAIMRLAGAMPESGWDVDRTPMESVSGAALDGVVARRIACIARPQ